MTTAYLISIFTSENHQVLSNPIDVETEKAIMIEVPTGLWTDQSSKNLWIPKSIIDYISEEVEETGIKNDGSEYQVIRQKVILPDWFINKNSLI